MGTIAGATIRTSPFLLSRSFVPQDDRKIWLSTEDELMYTAAQSCLSDEGGICWATSFPRMINPLRHLIHFFLIQCHPFCFLIDV